MNPIGTISMTLREKLINSVTKCTLAKFTFDKSKVIVLSSSLRRREHETKYRRGLLFVSKMCQIWPKARRRKGSLNRIAVGQPNFYLHD